MAILLSLDDLLSLSIDFVSIVSTAKLESEFQLKVMIIVTTLRKSGRSGSEEPSDDIGY